MSQVLLHVATLTIKREVSNGEQYSSKRSSYLNIILVIKNETKAPLVPELLKFEM